MTTQHTYNHKNRYQLMELTANGYAEFVPNSDGTVMVHSEKHLWTDTEILYANDAKSLFYALIKKGYSLI